MIPLTLELKNFLSYGDTIERVDFSSYDLICLAGKNGNGKSALLDALTWAIWGHARKIIGATKADEGLLRIGQKRMMVCAEFEFNQQVYRVRREYAKTYGKPYSALDFEIFDPEKKAFSSLTDKTVKTTQAKIEALLGIDYETFINTSFLKQGQAHEFSKKTPKERKNILSSILGLAQYDELQQKALDHIKNLNDQKKLISSMLEQAAQEITQETPFLAEKETLQKNIETLTEHLTQNAEQILSQEKARAVFSSLATTYHHMEQEAQHITSTYEQHLTQLKTIRTAWQHTHTHLLKLPNQEEVERTYTQQNEQEKTLIAQQEQFLLVQEQFLHCSAAYTQRKSFLQTHLEKQCYVKKIESENLARQYQHNITALEHQRKLLKELGQKHSTITQELTHLTTTIDQLNQQTASYKTEKQQFEKRRTAYQAFIQKGNWLKTTLQESAQKKAVVHDLTNPACPLCEQVLTIKRKQFLAAKLIEQDRHLNHQMRRLTTLIKNLKTILVDQHAHLTEQEKNIEKLRAAEEQARLLRNTLNDLVPVYDKLIADIAAIETQQKQEQASQEKLAQELKQLEEQGAIIIMQDPELVAHAQKLKQLEQEKQAFNTLKEQQEKLKHHITLTKKILETCHAMAREKEQQVLRRHTVQHLATQLKRMKVQLTTLKQRMLELHQQRMQESHITATLSTLATTQKNLQAQKDVALQTYMRLTSELERINKIKQEATVKKEQLTTIEQEIDDYHILAQAFSKNGIQALLIEEAIPEIEQEANSLLARLTDNQAQIFIESLRDLKSGGTKESLDIHISDAAGIRPYEMYSGGEAFRVDFALRIAISKLLARRAGTALQTLIIDEGFGSQDDDGISRITDALYAIRHDFSKIIIVSHLSEMKDSFPVHFMVEKLPSGSTVRIIERG